MTLKSASFCLAIFFALSPFLGFDSLQLMLDLPHFFARSFCSANDAADVISELLRSEQLGSILLSSICQLERRTDASE
jgi:hypothetical protein